MVTTTVQAQVATPEELARIGSFTFAEWVQAHDCDASKAVTALNQLAEQGEIPTLEQPEAGDYEGIWDGGFEHDNGTAWYVGSDGPGVGTPGRNLRRVVLANDTITLY